MEDAQLLVNLVLALGIAAVGGALAARLGQSVILGYIIAGVAIGPYTPGLVGDVESVEALADIGIILLLFAIGVELSIRDLLRVGKVAILGGGLQIVAMIGLGYAAGFALGWQPLTALFFGAAVAISSSTVLSKILAEHGVIGAEHGRIALAWAAVQDLSLIVLVVVLSAVSRGEGLGAADILWETGKAVAFLALIIPLGATLLPRLFEWVAALLNRELFVITVAAFALGMAYFSTVFGLSAALGAFVAGVVVSESDLSHQILGSIIPLRDIFAALFFVSVGMLVDPRYVLEHPGLVLLALVLVIVAKGLISAELTLAFRYPLRTAVLTGVVLAQAGEFSFLLARLGVTLGVVPGDAFNLIMVGTAVSIILSPSAYAAAVPSLRWLERRLPVPGPPLPVTWDGPSHTSFSGHAVLCGYGRVGRLVGAALRRRGFTFVVIDHNPQVVQSLRKQGVYALLGNAENPVLLDHACLKQARVLVVSIPDALTVRQIVEYARQVRPDLDIVVRVQSDAEVKFMRSRQVNEAVIGEQELALEMARHTLRRFGVSAIETLAMLQRLRGGLEEEEPGGYVRREADT